MGRDKYVVVGINYDAKFVTGFSIHDKKMEAQKRAGTIQVKNQHVKIRILPIKGEDVT